VCGGGPRGGIHHGLEFLTSVKSNDAARTDGNFFAGLGVASGALGLVAQLKITEA